MRWILDANCLIYLVKTRLIEKFYELLEKKIVIDSSVYQEVVIEGIKQGYQDAREAEKFLHAFQIPIIPVDIREDLIKFRDPGETSCYILARQEGICLTSDIRATKKFQQYGIKWMQLDIFFYHLYREGKINRDFFKLILDKLERVNGTTSERRIILLEHAREENHND